MWAFIIWIVLIAFTLFYIWRNKNKLSIKISIPLYLIKISSGLAIGMYYYHFKEQSGDSFYFFNTASEILQKPIAEIFEFVFYSQINLDIDTPRSALFLKFLIPICWVSLCNYWLASILIGSMSYLILLILFIRYFQFFSKDFIILIFSFFVFPSVLIWTSGIFKESFVFISLLVSLIALLDYIFKKKVNFWVLIMSLFAFLIFFKLRYFYSIFLLLIVGLYLYRTLSPKFSIPISLLLLASVIGILIFHPVLNPIELPFFIYNSHHRILSFGNNGIDLYYSFSQADWFSIIVNLPFAFVNAFLRPFPWEWQNIQLFIYSIENYILLAAFLLFSFKSNRIAKHQYVIILLLLIALTFVSLATPNFGSLYRYKSICLPFLMYLLIHPLKLSFAKS
ncbi:hypothetical protein HZR84_13505 [Hyphobacterium sp. CCMP332]|nr:hypothetical protein HZR84_13505 [Hyphobacterium sp. CCMP332]